MLIQFPGTKAPVTYRLLNQLQPGEISAAFIEIVLAKNGLFARGRREGLEVALPVAQIALPGSLYEGQAYLKLAYPRPGSHLMEQMLRLARDSYDPQTGQPLEILFYLYWEEVTHAWQLYLPPQEQTPYRVRPLLTSAQEKEIYARTLIEVHSHPLGRAYFSRIDDQDERVGFRLFGCLADIFGKPQIRFRVGLHGYFWEFPAELLWELRPEVEDALNSLGKGDQEANELAD